MQVSGAGSSLGMEAVTAEDVESCAVHVLSRGSAHLHACALSARKGYCIVVKVRARGTAWRSRGTA